jgi:hypothetical protein
MQVTSNAVIALNARIAAIGAEFDALVARLAEENLSNRARKALEKKSTAVMHERDALTAERDTLIAIELDAFENAESTVDNAADGFRFPKASDFTAIAVVSASEAEAEADTTEAFDASEAEAEAKAEAEKPKAEKPKNGDKKTLSEAIADTWKRPDVRAKRLTKDTVEVTVEGATVGFSSVWKAFESFGLPAEKHIRFRGKLKQSRAEVFEHDGVRYEFAYNA